MTEAVGGAGQSAAQNVLDAVSQGASARAGTRMRKADAKVARDDEPQQESSTRGLEPATSGEARVENDGKVARRRERGETKDGDDADTSFAATIDSIDRPAPQTAATDATQGAQQGMRWTPEMAFGQIALDRSARTMPTDVAAVSTDADTPMRSPKLLKPESITALLAAQNRMLSGDGTIADGTSADAATPTPIVVNSQETHWRFDAKVPPAAPLPTAAPTPTSLADGSLAANPLAMLTAAGATKGTDKTTVAASPFASPAAASAKTSDNANIETDSVSKQAQAPASVDAVAVSDDPSRQSPAGQQGGGANTRDAATNGASDRKVAESVASRAVGHTSPDDTATSTGLSPAATQVRNGVLDALNGGADDATPSSPTASLQDKPAAPAQVLRTMELTLSPADLGSVKLKLSLKSNELSIEAETSKAATAKILNDDRDGLTQNLRDAGYDVSTLKITDAAASGAMGSNSSQTGGQPGNPAFQDGSQARASFAERQGGDMQRRDGAAQEQDQQRSKGGSPTGAQTGDTTGPRQSNAIYI